MVERTHVDVVSISVVVLRVAAPVLSKAWLPHTDPVFIALLIRHESSSARTRNSLALLNYGFRFYETRLVYEAGGSIAEARVWKGDAENTDVGLKDDLYVTIPRGSFEKLRAQIELSSQIIAPVTPRTPMGTVRINLDQETVAEANLFALVTINEGTIWQVAKDSLLLWFE